MFQSVVKQFYFTPYLEADNFEGKNALNLNKLLYLLINSWIILFTTHSNEMLQQERLCSIIGRVLKLSHMCIKREERDYFSFDGEEYDAVLNWRGE